MFIFKEHKRNIWALFHENGDKLSNDMVFQTETKAREWMSSWLSTYRIIPKYEIIAMETTNEKIN